MSGSGSPCGACKFLRRKCVKGCVFAPYFSHEQGATHFAAIHKVFGASNVSKLLGHLPLNDRSEAAITISYEAQARLQDPIYGCVSHIFSLQQQVVNLQAQLVALKQLQAAHQGIISGNNSTQNPNYERSCSNYPQDVQSWLQQSEYSHLVPPFESNYFNCSSQSSTIYGSNQSNHHGFDINHDRINSMALQDDQDVSFASFDGSSSHHSTSLASRDFENKSKWPYHDTDDLHSVAFGYPQHS